MSDPEVIQTPPLTPAQKLAELVARRKATAGEAGWGGGAGGRREAERSAAARSASKSKPAMKR